MNKLQLQRKKSLFFSKLTENESAETELPDERIESSPALNLDRRETSLLVREIMDKLPDGHRMLMAMYYYEQMSVAKIAEDLGLRTPELSKLNSAEAASGSRRRFAVWKRKASSSTLCLPCPFCRHCCGSKAQPIQQQNWYAPKFSETVPIQLGHRFFETGSGRVVLGLPTAQQTQPTLEASKAPSSDGEDFQWDWWSG